LSMNEEFAEAFGEELCLSISESIDDSNSVATVLKSWHNNALNIEGLASFEFEGKEIQFHYRNGNDNGFEVIDFSETPITMPKRYASIRKFAIDTNRVVPEKMPIMVKKFEALSEMISEKEKAMNYDMHFAGTSIIDRHYRDWATENFLVIVSESIEVD
jgi:hypothetical protein